MIHPDASDTSTVCSVFAIGPDRKVKPTIAYPASTGRNFEESFGCSARCSSRRAIRLPHGSTGTRAEDVIM